MSGDLLGTIAWGDGTSAFATISGGNGQFPVHGWHTYASAGRYKFSVQIKDEGSGKLAKHSLTLTVA